MGEKLGLIVRKAWELYLQFCWIPKSDSLKLSRFIKQLVQKKSVQKPKRTLKDPIIPDQRFYQCKIFKKN